MTFEINGVSTYQYYIVAGTYEVNQQTEYEEWTDANYTRHRTYKRNSVSGSFDMMIKDTAILSQFISVVEANTDSDTNTVPLTVSVNNKLTDYTGNFFVEFKNVRDLDGGMNDYIKQFTVEIEEA